VSDLTVVCLASKSAGDPSWTLKCTIDGTDYTSTVSTTTLAWHTFSHSMGADTAVEKEIEISFDGNEATAATTQYLPMVEAYEDVSSAYPFSAWTGPPGPALCLPRKPITFETWRDCAQALNELWYRRGRQILFSDWRAYDARLGGLNYQKNDNVFATPKDFGQGASTMCQSIVYPSSGSTKLRVYMDLICRTAAVAKHYGCNIGDSYSWDVQEYRDTEAGDAFQKFERSIAIPAAHWDEGYPGSGDPANEPWKVILWGENAATAWMEPRVVSIFEEPIGPNEWPW